MPLFELTDQEADIIMDHIANTMTWAKANALLVKMSQQIQAQIPKQHTVTVRPGADGSAIPLDEESAKIVQGAPPDFRQ